MLVKFRSKMIQLFRDISQNKQTKISKDLFVVFFKLFETDKHAPYKFY